MLHVLPMSKPFIVVCGSPGTGKSTEVLKAFQDSLCLLSAPNNMHYFKKLHQRGKLEGYRPPKKIKLIDAFNMGTTKEDYSFDIQSKASFDEEGNLVPIPQKENLEATVFTVMKKSMEAMNNGEPPPYSNLIMDECGTFWQRVFDEIAASPECRTSAGKQDTRQAYGLIGTWSMKMTNWMRQLVQCNVGVALVLHDRDPDGDKKGGPKTPGKASADQLCSDADGVIQRVMQDPPVGSEEKAKRIWCATAGEKWNRKLRGLEPEDEEVIAEMPLQDILTDLAGFDL